MVRSFLLTIAYDGRNYRGWQRQEGFDSVQERLEDAVATIYGEPLVVHGAGRTDAGVHALRQCAHFRVGSSRGPREPETVRDALNGNLPPDVVVRGVRRVPAAFHARFSACGKRYVYRCLVGRLRPVFHTGLMTWIRRGRLDVAAMRRAAALIEGTHDFAAFATNPGYARKRPTVRTVHHVRLAQRPMGFDLFVQGNGFLYNMVRTMVGTLVEVGIGDRGPDDVLRILQSRDRREAGPNLPPDGLYLQRVLYPADAFDPSPKPFASGRGDRERLNSEEE